MTIRIEMPQLGESVSEGTIAQWYVQPGDRVEIGQALLEVETDKANADVPATTTGVISKLLFQVGETVAVGTVILELTTGDAPAAAPAPSAAVGAPVAAVVAAPATPAAPPAPAAPAPVASATPAAPSAAPGAAGTLSRIAMPQLGESVSEGTIAQWFVKAGDRVEPGTALLEVETDKANADVPSTDAGYVVRLLEPAGAVVAVGQDLIELSDVAPGTGEAPAAPAPAAASPTPAAAAPTPPAPPTPVPRVATPSSPAASTAAPPPPPIPAGARAWGNADGIARPTPGAHIALPLAAPPAAPRTAAATAATPSAAAASTDAGAPLGTPLGMRTYKVPKVVAGPNDTVNPFNKRRAIISEHMVYSKHVSPHVPCFAEVDMTLVGDLRKKHKKRMDEQGIPLTILAFLMSATAQALRETPAVNAVVGNQEVIQRADVNLGCAVETEAGLVVPVIRNADRLTVGDMGAAIRDMANKARDKKITADDLAGGTFTVSNPGRKGNLFGAAIINQPQVGILRMGEIVRRPVVREIDGEEVICIRSMMFLSLSYDHRVIDGVVGNGFLFRVRELLEAGAFEI